MSNLRPPRSAPGAQASGRSTRRYIPGSSDHEGGASRAHSPGAPRLSHPARRIFAHFSRLYSCRFGKPYHAYRPGSEDAIAIDLFLAHALGDVRDIIARIERVLARSSKPMDLMHVFLSDFASECKRAARSERAA